MTMICPAKNKAELKTKLDAGCIIEHPTPWGTNLINSRDVRPGPDWMGEPVVLDPDTRRRFAQITKLADGTWKVR
jgi:hypothetical protein